MPTTGETLRSLQTALQEAQDRTDMARYRMLLTEHGLASGNYARLEGKVEGLKLARRIVEALSS